MVAVGKIILILLGIGAVVYILSVIGNIFQDKFVYTMFLLGVIFFGGIVVGLVLENKN